MNQVFGISIVKICLFLSNLVASFRRVLLVDALGEISWLGKPPHHVKVGIIDGYDNCNFSDKNFFQVSLRNKFSCYKLKQLCLLLSPQQNDVILLRWNLSQPGLQISWSCLTMHKKIKFSIKDFFSKSAGSCGIGHIYWRNPLWKTSFFVQCDIISWRHFIINWQWWRVSMIFICKELF